MNSVERGLVVDGRRQGTLVGAAGVLAIVLSIGVAHWLNSRYHGESGKKGSHLVVMVDDSAINIPQALVIDGPTLRALKVDGKCTICGITEQWTKDQGYTHLLEESGGAPAALVLDDEGGCVHKGRLPTDKKAVDSLVERFIGMPDPLPGPKSDRVIDRGHEIQVFRAANGQEWVETDGHARMLSAKPALEKFAALPSYASNNPTFPASQWYDLSRRDIFGGPDWIYDQDGLNSCVANGGARTLRCLRVLAGMKDVKLSPGFLYHFINGGRDEGASVPSIIPALEKYGTCPFSLCGQNWQRIAPAMTQAAADYKLVDGYRCNTWEEAVSALLTGRYVIAFGVQVGPSFYKFDEYGVCGHTDGPGNHCIMADGVKKLPDGRIVLDAANSWGFNFGPWKNGRMYIDKQHLFGGGDRPSTVAMRIAGRAKQDPYNPPILKP